MAWPTPSSSRSAVNRAGSFLKQDGNLRNHEDYFIGFIESHGVLANWRACHGSPINTFQATLRTRLKKIDVNAIVAQRLKRTPSIISKLRRFEKMELSRMQDIGGLRAVVENIDALEKLFNEYQSKPLTHQLIAVSNYVIEPKDSGYRSIHLVYRFKSRDESPYDGLMLELQFRTRIQHSWATAVETAGTFLEYSLKSSEGPREWLRFFSLVSSAFAYLEGTPRVPGYEGLTTLETFKQTIAEAKRLKIRENLLAFSKAVLEIPPSGRSSKFYLVQLNLNDKKKLVTVTSFARDKLDIANTAYAQAETDGEKLGTQVVLVSAGSIDSLKRAYPNYFLDTHEFLLNLKRVELLAEKP